MLGYKQYITFSAFSNRTMMMNYFRFPALSGFSTFSSRSSLLSSHGELFFVWLITSGSMLLWYVLAMGRCKMTNKYIKASFDVCLCLASIFWRIYMCIHRILAIYTILYGNISTNKPCAMMAYSLPVFLN